MNICVYTYRHLNQPGSMQDKLKIKINNKTAISFDVVKKKDKKGKYNIHIIPSTTSLFA